MIWYYLLAVTVGSIPFGKLANIVARHRLTSSIKIKTKKNSYLLLAPFLSLFISIFDIAKIYLLVTITLNMFQDYLFSFSLAFFAVLGDCFSPLLKFKGNKGIAASIGYLLAIEPIAVIYIFLLYFVILVINKHPHISAVITFILFSIVLIYIETNALFVLFFMLISFIITSRHLKNIKRYLTGKEITLKTWFEQRNG